MHEQAVTLTWAEMAWLRNLLDMAANRVEEAGLKNAPILDEIRALKKKLMPEA